MATKAFSAQTVAKQLSKHFRRDLPYVEGDEVEDGSVELTNKSHIQVGETYLCLVTELQDETFLFGEMRTHVQSILQDCRDKNLVV